MRAGQGVGLGEAPESLPCSAAGKSLEDLVSPPWTPRGNLFFHLMTPDPFRAQSLTLPCTQPSICRVW